MKKLIVLILVVSTTGCVQAQNSIPVPEWRMTLTVIDEQNQPVAGAETKIWYHVPPPEDESVALAKKVGLTDSNGVFTASERSTTIELMYEAFKTGYYAASGSYELGLPFQYDSTKWSPTVTLLLKKIRTPIPMYAKWVKSSPPVVNEPVGYDLAIGDWVVPHGRGQVSDLIFTKKFSLQSTSDYESKVTLNFSNPGDGIQLLEPSALDKTCALRSPHKVPEDGYQPLLTRETSAHPNQPGKFEYDPNRIYFIRVRTILDENGNVKSAHYGKIYGDFMQFRYYLNPTPNDRNIEFDPKQNLLKGLRSTERVDAP